MTRADVVTGIIGLALAAFAVWTMPPTAVDPNESSPTPASSPPPQRSNR